MPRDLVRVSVMFPRLREASEEGIRLLTWADIAVQINKHLNKNKINALPTRG
jgi:hypothetical protein